MLERSRSIAPRPAGYTELVRRFDLRVLPNAHESWVGCGSAHRIERVGASVREVYPERYWPGESVGDHLEFALKHDGTNLALLDRVFRAATLDDLVSFIRSKPLGKYARRLWYLVEWLLDVRLPLDDLSRGNYIDLLEPADYVTGPEHIVRRQRLRANLLGDRRFCPTIRRTDVVKGFEAVDLRARCTAITAPYPPELLRRALAYLYTKETKSSFEIEHVEPPTSRAARFVALLQSAEREDFCSEPRLLELQNRIVDPRFAAKGYRATQNYVGQTVSLGHEKIHFVAPRPDDLPDLMAGLLDLHRRVAAAGVHPVEHAAAVAWGFVFLHPFDDGNGRIHRFLIHNVLALRGVTPPGLMFPVSAAMLRRAADYDASLEAFSTPLAAQVDYVLDDEGRMTVLNETAVWYRYLDLTAQVEALFSFVQATIETDLPAELRFLAGHDRARVAIQQVLDLPDRLQDLFLRVCLDNQGRLSARKRASHFAMLTDAEVSELERIVRESFELPAPATER